MVFGGVWCWRWSQSNTLVFCCLVKSGVGDGLSPIHLFWCLGIWCWRWSQSNILMFWCLVESGVGDGLSPIHSCFGVWWSLVFEMVSVQYTRVLVFGSLVLEMVSI